MSKYLDLRLYGLVLLLAITLVLINWPLVPIRSSMHESIDTQS